MLTGNLVGTGEGDGTTGGSLEGGGCTELLGATSTVDVDDGAVTDNVLVVRSTGVEVVGGRVARLVVDGLGSAGDVDTTTDLLGTVCTTVEVVASGGSILTDGCSAHNCTTSEQMLQTSDAAP